MDGELEKESKRNHQVTTLTRKYARKKRRTYKIRNTIHKKQTNKKFKIKEMK